MQRLLGKVAIVTGSTQGLGEGIARRLAREGAKIVVNGRSEEKGARVLAALRELGAETMFVRADVGIKDEATMLVARTAERFGRVDILINNAQAQTPYVETLDACNDAYITRTLHSGLYGSLWTAQAAQPHMRAASGGRVVNFASLNGVFGARYAAAYNVTKEAIRALTRTLANEWGVYGITVNTLLPSGLSPAYEAFFEGDAIRAEASAKAIPMRRHGRAEDDIGSAVLGLVSDSGRFITGQSLFVDGGQNLLGLPQLHDIGTRQ